MFRQPCCWDFKDVAFLTFLGNTVSLQTSSSSSFYNLLTLFPSLLWALVQELCCTYSRNNWTSQDHLFSFIHCDFPKELFLATKENITRITFICCYSSHVIQTYFIIFFIILGTFHALWMSLPLLVPLVVILCSCLSNSKSTPFTFYQKCLCSLNIALRMPVALFLFSNTASLTVKNECSCLIQIYVNISKKAK